MNYITLFRRKQIIVVDGSFSVPRVPVPRVPVRIIHTVLLAWIVAQSDYKR